MWFPLAPLSPFVVPPAASESPDQRSFMALHLQLPSAAGDRRMTGQNTVRGLR